MVGWYKYNVDAGFHKDWNKINTGWCLHDHMERFVMAETTWKDVSCSILEGKSIVLIEAFRVMGQRDISHFIFETNSKSVVDAIRDFDCGSSEF
jgi:hypothetical protein